MPAPGPLPQSLGGSYRRAVPPPDLPDAASGTAEPIAAAVLAAASGSQLEATLRDVVQAAVTHVDARYGAMGVFTPDGRRLDRFVVVGMDDADSERIGLLPSGKGLLGLRLEQPLRLDDLNTHPAARGFPPGHPPMRSFLGVPVRVGEWVFGNLYLTEKRTGGSFSASDVGVAQALAAVAGLAIDNARLAERAEIRRRWSQAGTDLATALLSGADPDEVLRSVSTRVSALTDADMAGVLVPTLGDDDALTIFAAVGPGAADIEGVRVPLAGTDVGRTHAERRARLIDDISTMPVVGRRSAISVELTRGYGPALLTPVGQAHDAALLVALRRFGREAFDPEDLELLSAFAAQSSVVLELARAQQRERRLQVQADRDRIARDLHDHVVQRLFATTLSLDRLSRSLVSQQPEAAARLSRSVDELDRTMADIRAAIFELHEQEDADPCSLDQQVAELVRQVTEDSPLRRNVRVRGSLEKLPRSLVPDLLAVVRELVSNVVRHAGASRVGVAVTVDDCVRVTVSDDGRGLPRAPLRSGLANLAHRAERRGGRLTTRARRRGTEVRWEVPLPVE